MRKIIAQRLTESKSGIPHYYVTIEVDMRQALGLREQLNKLAGLKIVRFIRLLPQLKICLRYALKFFRRW